jgi:hypothetical protein
VFNDINREKLDKVLSAYREAGIPAHGHVRDIAGEVIIPDGK